MAPTDAGSSAITGYVLTPYIEASGVCTAKTAIDLGNVTSHVVTGLTNGTAYTFTVAAINSVGTVLTSPFSSPITPAAVVPGAPTIGTATAGKGSVKLTWTAPSSNGGATITHYVITPSHGSPVTVGDVTSDTITGLTNGTAYTFKVAATNSAGTGPASAASKSVTPDGLYITTKTLPKATKGKKYTAVKLAEKGGVGKLTWTATGLPKGLTVSSAGITVGHGEQFGCREDLLRDDHRQGLVQAQADGIDQVQPGGAQVGAGPSTACVERGTVLRHRPWFVPWSPSIPPPPCALRRRRA